MSETTQPQESILKKTGSFLPNLIGIAVLLAAGYGLRHGSLGEIAWFISAICMTAIRIPHSKQNQNNEIIDDKKDIIETAVLFAMFIAMGLLPYIELATRVFSFADYSLPSWAMMVGLIAQVPMLWLFWRSHADLGKNWSPGLEIREDHGLVTGGVYARMRHPMYAAIWISVLAQPLLIQNWIAGALVVPVFLLMYVTRIPKEEAMMRETFGESYDSYKASTGRVFPKLSRGSR